MVKGFSRTSQRQPQRNSRLNVPRGFVLPPKLRPGQPDLGDKLSRSASCTLVILSPAASPVSRQSAPSKTVKLPSASRTHRGTERSLRPIPASPDRCFPSKRSRFNTSGLQASRQGLQLAETQRGLPASPGAARNHYSTPKRELLLTAVRQHAPSCGKRGPASRIDRGTSRLPHPMPLPLQSAQLDRNLRHRMS